MRRPQSFVGGVIVGCCIAASLWFISSLRLATSQPTSSNGPQDKAPQLNPTFTPQAHQRARSFFVAHPSNAKLVFDESRGFKNYHLHFVRKRMQFAQSCDFSKPPSNNRPTPPPNAFHAKWNPLPFPSSTQCELKTATPVTMHYREKYVPNLTFCLLLSYPRSGNSYFRTLFDSISQTWSASAYGDSQLSSFLRGETLVPFMKGYKNSRCMAPSSVDNTIPSHPWPHTLLVKSHDKRWTGFSHLFVLMRNPFNAFRSYAALLSTRKHSGQATNPKKFAEKLKFLLDDHPTWWSDLANCTIQRKTQKETCLRLTYEELLENPYHTLVIYFLWMGFPRRVIEPQIRCVLSQQTLPGYHPNTKALQTVTDGFSSKQAKTLFKRYKRLFCQTGMTAPVPLACPPLPSFVIAVNFFQEELSDLDQTLQTLAHQQGQPIFGTTPPVHFDFYARPEMPPSFPSFVSFKTFSSHTSPGASVPFGYRCALVVLLLDSQQPPSIAKLDWTTNMESGFKFSSCDSSLVTQFSVVVPHTCTTEKLVCQLKTNYEADRNDFVNKAVRFGEHLNSLAPYPRGQGKAAVTAFAVV
eukprot:m.65063 g.65063  ORF g.65063 m.65063 type:complete len:580 (+) comp19604_c0_seq2:56-1795(+)